jgi:hypothetical protein
MGYFGEAATPEFMTQIGPYSRPSVLSKLDQRTREARLVRETRADLLAHLGGNASATQRALIDQAVSLKLHIALMDRKASETGGIMSERDGRQYLAWANALSRLLRQLGMKGAPERPRTLADIRARQTAP